MRRRTQRLSLTAMFALAVAVAATGIAGHRGDGDTPVAEIPEEGTGFSVYALSRGKGVPDEARAVLEQAALWLDEAARESPVEIRRTRIGIEGETRLCATFQDRAIADALLMRIRELAQDVDLVNVMVGPCD
ncbi:MAG: hypothetical protein ABFS23_00220 [Pseudomonadota bacterium]